MTAPPRILLVGGGGVGQPALLALATALGSPSNHDAPSSHEPSGALRQARGSRPPLRVELLDDDQVDPSNLPRQILFSTRDIGTHKLSALARSIAERFPELLLSVCRARVDPFNALALIAGASVVVDACDNFETRFLLADACALAGVPVVHAAALQWRATCLVSGARGRAPCYRCLFEEPPSEAAPTCGTAGVIGPVCGVIGALAAQAALSIVKRGEQAALASLWQYDGLRGELRQRSLSARSSCELCGSKPSIHSIDAGRYAPPRCET